MKGLIKKDLFMLKSNMRYIIIFSVLYFFIASNQADDVFAISFILPFLMVVMMNSTFSYDEYNKWFSYAVTMPNGRANIAKSKYIVAILGSIFASILSILLIMILASFKGSLNLDNLASSTVSSIFACLFMVSIMFPFILKYGTEKGRLVMFVISFVIIGGSVLLFKMPKFKISAGAIIFLTKYSLLLTVIISVIMVGISYFISKKIISKKEF